MVRIPGRPQVWSRGNRARRESTGRGAWRRRATVPCASALPCGLPRGRRPRRMAARCACAASAEREAEERGSRRNAPLTARDRLGDGRRRLRPRATSRAALRLVAAEAFPRPGAPSLTPARLAFDRPIAIACLGDRAPCLPSRMWCISSRTNSAARSQQAPPSRRRLLHGLPGPCRDLLAERLLDERHEDRSSGTRDVGAEDLAALHPQDARAIALDGQLELRPGRAAE